MANSRRGSWLRVARSLAGATLLLAGLGWLGLLGRDFVRIQLRLMPSWDVAFTFWLPLAAVTGPAAAGLAWLGWEFLNKR